MAELGQPGTLKFVEGELIFPEIENSIATGSEVNTTATSSNTNNDLINQIKSGQVNVDGANVIQNADGSITIGGDGEVPEGSTLVQSAEPQYDTTAAPDYAPDQVVLSSIEW